VVIGHQGDVVGLPRAGLDLAKRAFIHRRTPNGDVIDQLQVRLLSY
jgi:hypothetical protein